MDYRGVLDYIEAYWPHVIKEQAADDGPLIGLPRPFAAPSHEPIFHEQFYWDSYFISLGLIDTDLEYLVVDMAENMFYLLERFGIIPNANRFYFLSRSQPPILTSMLKLALEVKRRRGDDDLEVTAERWWSLAEREYREVWMGESFPHVRQVFRGLSRYFDANYLNDLIACESGWDHSTRCRGDWLSHLPIDLNAMLYRYETDFAERAKQRSNDAAAEHWQSVAARRSRVAGELCWDESQDFFFDFDFVSGHIEPTVSLAGFYPLWAGMVSEARAARLVEQWLPKLRFPGGMVTSMSSQETKQWAYPNGWAPLQWIVAEGLERYGFKGEAQEIRRLWCDTCAQAFGRTGVLHEKYNVVDPSQPPEPGLYGTIEGFGWTNGVFVDFAKKLV